jgi:molybdopterin molybdotransferase
VDGVALKPGKPVAVARLGALAVVVLPGNPGAATVAFDQLGRPLLLKLQGVREERRCVRARLSQARHKQAGLTYLITATVEYRDGGETWARMRPQGAGQILQNVGAEGFAILPPGRADFAEGDEVDLELFDRPRYMAVDG